MIGKYSDDEERQRENQIDILNLNPRNIKLERSNDDDPEIAKSEMCERDLSTISSRK